MKKLLIWTTVLAILTVLLIRWAYISRGYWAVGAEWFWWIVPVLILAMDGEGEKRNEDETV